MHYHIPVLLKEVIELLAPKPNDNVIDCTLGGGGHARVLLKAIGPNGQLLGIDADPSAHAHVRKIFSESELKRTTLVQDDFVNLEEIVQRTNFKPVNGVLLDLGVSSDQIDQGERGFSFMGDGPLVMSFGTKGKESAQSVVNTYSKEQLKEILKKYGEVGRPGVIAARIDEARARVPITTTKQLRQALVGFSSAAELNRPQIKLLAKVFQAIRTEVNQELSQLEHVLPAMNRLLAPGARVAVISYHSLEDRIVKQYFKHAAEMCTCPPNFPICTCNTTPVLTRITKKVMRASEREVKENPRARSAKLRVAEKCE